MRSSPGAAAGITVRAARLGIVVSVAGFWLTAAQGARREPGYHPARDHLSALALVALGAGAARVPRGGLSALCWVAAAGTTLALAAWPDGRRVLRPGTSG